MKILVVLEACVLAVNSCECQLGTPARPNKGNCSPNFDNYLPNWLATRTLVIFGPWFTLGMLTAMIEWLLVR
jgi:hypothetical protein